MKKIIALLSIVAVAAMTSCSKDSTTDLEWTPALEGINLTLNADSELDESRTQVSEGGSKAIWEESDRIIVFNLFNYNAAQGGFTAAFGTDSESIAIDSEGIATFEATLASLTEDTHSTEVNDNQLYFVYPSDTASETNYHQAGSTEIQHFTVPALQFPTLNSFDGNADVLVGRPVAVEGAMTTAMSEKIRFSRKSAIILLNLADDAANTLGDLADMQVRRVILDAEVAEESGNEHPLAGDKLHINIHQTQGEAIDLYEIYSPADGEPSYRLIADYTHAESPEVALSDIMGKESRTGVWFSMLPQTLTSLTVTVELEGGASISFAKRSIDGGLAIQSSHVKPINLTYDESKGDTAVAPMIRAEVLNIGAYTLDVQLKLNTDLCQKAFATVRPYGSYAGREDKLVADITDAAISSDSEDAYFESFVFATTDALYNESNLIKNTPRTNPNCTGVLFAKQLDDSNHVLEHDYFVIYGAKDTEGEWHIAYGVVDLFDPSELLGIEDSAVTISIPEETITKNEAVATITIDGTPAKVIYYYSDMTLDTSLGSIPGAVPVPYNGEPIVLELDHLRKDSPYFVHVITIDEEGNLGEPASEMFETKGDIPGDGHILDCTFEPQIECSRLTAHLSVDAATVGVRILAMTQNAFERYDPQSMVSGDEMTLDKLLYSLTEGEGYEYTINEGDNRNDLVYNISILPYNYTDENTFERITVYDDNHIIVAAAVDANGNLQTANLVTLAALNDPDGATLKHQYEAGGTTYRVNYWKTITEDQTTGNFVAVDGSNLILSPAWLTTPKRSSMTTTFTTKGLSKVIFFVQDCDTYCAENASATARELLFDPAYSEYRTMKEVSIVGGSLDAEATVAFNSELTLSTSYILWASGVTFSGDYVEPINVAQLLAETSEENRTYDYQGTPTTLPYFYEHQQTITAEQWNGTATASLTFLEPGARLASWKLDLDPATGETPAATSVIRYVFSSNTITPEQMIAKIKATAHLIDPDKMSITKLTSLTDPDDELDKFGYYTYIQPSNTINVYPFSAGEFTNCTWAFVVVSEEGEDTDYNIYSYVRCQQSNPVVEYFATESTPSGEAHILSATIDPQIECDRLTLHLSLSENTTAIRVMAIPEAEYASLSSAQIAQRLQDESGDYYTQYAVTNGISELDDYVIDIAIPALTRSAGSNYAIFAAAVDANGLTEQVINISTLAGGSALYPTIAEDNYPGTWRGVHMITDNFGAEWGRDPEPGTTELYYRFTTLTFTKLILFVQECDDYCANNLNVDPKVLLTDNAYAQHRLVYKIPTIRDGVAYLPHSTEVKFDIDPEKCYIVWVTGVDRAGRFIYPMNVNVMLGGYADTREYKYNDTNYEIPFYYTPEMTASDDIWAGTATVEVAFDTSKTNVWTKCLITQNPEVKSVVRYLFASSDISEEKIVEKVQATWEQVNSSTGVSAQPLEDPEGEYTMSYYTYMNTAADGATVTTTNVNKTTKKEYAGYTWAFVVVGNDGMNNIQCYIRGDEGHNPPIHTIE